jgi:hypothetical protein
MERRYGPSASALNITGPTVVKASPGKIGTACLNSVASTASTVIDAAGRDRNRTGLLYRE